MNNEDVQQVVRLTKVMVGVLLALGVLAWVTVHTTCTVIGTQPVVRALAEAETERQEEVQADQDWRATFESTCDGELSNVAGTPDCVEYPLRPSVTEAEFATQCEELCTYIPDYETGGRARVLDMDYERALCVCLRQFHYHSGNPVHRYIDWQEVR